MPRGEQQKEHLLRKNPKDEPWKKQQTSEEYRHHFLLDCFKTFFNLKIFSESAVSSSTGGGGPGVMRVVTKEDPRVLRAADVFFDRNVQSALATLQQEFYYAQKRQQQEQSRIFDELLPPLLESALSSDESSSSGSTSSCSSGSSSVFHELIEVSALHEISHVSQNTMLRNRQDDDDVDDDDSATQFGDDEHEIGNCRVEDDDTEDNDGNSEDRQTAAVRTLKSSGNQDRLALTLTGSKGVNQDCGMVVHPLLVNRKEPTMMLGVFDGHAKMGHLVSEHCRRQLEEVITAELESRPCIDNSEEIVQVLTRIVEEVDEKIPTNMSEYGGTTLSSILQLGDTLYLLNTGDSMSLVCAYIPKFDQCVVLEMTERHVPEVRQERSRILRSGGWINPQGYVLYERGDGGFALGMSRSLGDRGAPGVIATPDIKVLSVQKLKEEVIRHFPVDSSGRPTTPNDIFLLGVSVSDGVLDVASVDEVASCLTRAFFASSHNSGTTSSSLDDDSKGEIHHDGPPATTAQELPHRLHPMVAVEHVIQSCAKRWQEEYNGEYRDDITFAAAKLL